MSEHTGETGACRCHPMRSTAQPTAGSGEARLTEAEREDLLIASHTVEPIQDVGKALFAAVGRILADRAAGENDLRAAVLALADDLSAEIEELRGDLPPEGASRVAQMYRTAGLSDARDRLHAALAATGGDHDA